MLLKPEKINNALLLLLRLRGILCLPVSIHTVSVPAERSRIRRSTIVCQSAFRFPPDVPAERRAADGDVCRKSLRDLGGPESRPEVESRLPAAFRKPQGVREGVGPLGVATEKAAAAEVGVTCDWKRRDGGELRGSPGLDGASLPLPCCGAPAESRSCGCA